MPELVWKKVRGSGSKYGFLGEIHIFTISYRITKSRDDPEAWVLQSALPGHRDLFVNGATEPELMTKAAEIFDEWLEKIGVRECPEK